MVRGSTVEGGLLWPPPAGKAQPGGEGGVLAQSGPTRAVGV